MAYRIAAAMWAFGIATSAWGNGVKIPTPGYAKLPEIPQQGALIAWRDRVETLVVESTYSTASPEVGWVLPVPAAPTGIAVADRDVLTSIGMSMRPKVIHDQGNGPYAASWLLGAVLLGSVIAIARKPGKSIIVPAGVAAFVVVLLSSIMLPALGPAPGDGVAAAGASVLSSSRVGGYTVTALKTPSSAGLDEWLAQNGLAKLPDAGVRAVDDYAKAGWVFLVAKLSHAPDGEPAAAHPLAVTFPTSRPVFPMRLTALAQSTTQVNLYVVADQEASASGFARKSVDRYRAVAEDTTNVGRSEAVIAAHFKAASNHLVIGSPDASKWLWDNCVVTHLAADLKPAQMADDVWLTLSPMRRAARETFYSRQGRWQTTLEAGLIGGAILVGLFGCACRHRRWPGKRNRRALVVVAVLVLGGVAYVALEYPVVAVVQDDPETEGAEMVGSRVLERIRQRRVAGEVSMSLRSTTRPAGLREAVAAVLADPGFKRWTLNPLTGKPMVEQRTPGNYAIQTNEGRLELLLYDVDGSEMRVPVEPALPSPITRVGKP